MMNPQMRVIPPAILKIATLINFFTSFYIICLYALFLSYIYQYVLIFVFTLHVLYIHAKEKSNNSCTQSSICA